MSAEPNIAQLSPDAHYEVIGGQIVESQMGVYEAVIAGILHARLLVFLESRPTGRALIEVLFRFEEGLELRPDVAFLSSDRWAANRPVPRSGSWQVVPNLAVEVLSPSNTVRELATKIEDYFRCGVELVWTILPDQRQVFIYESPTNVRAISHREELDGGRIVPGFRMPVAELFP